MTGGGITFTNLFRGWPTERIATVTDDAVPLSYDICTQYYRITRKERRYIPPFCWVKDAQGVYIENEGTGTAKPSSRGFLISLLKSIIGNAGIPDQGRLSTDLSLWIEAYEPDVVYTILGSIGYIEIIDAIVTKYGFPLVVHFMDDGVTDPRQKGLFGNYIRNATSRRLKRLLSKSTKQMAISMAMAEEYKRRYGMTFQPFQNTIDLSAHQHLFKEEVTPGTPVKIAYVGSVNPLNNFQGLLDLTHIMGPLNKTGNNAVLEIYSPRNLYGDYVERLKNDPSIHIRPVPIDDETFFTVLNAADILFLPVNFDKNSIQYIRLSMPTKVPAYLSSGTPVLVYGPAGVAQVDYARESGWGYVVDKRSLGDLLNAVQRLSSDSNLRDRLSKAAQQATLENHNAEKVRSAFQRQMQAAGRP